MEATKCCETFTLVVSDKIIAHVGCSIYQPTGQDENASHYKKVLLNEIDCKRFNINLRHDESS